MQKMSFSMTNIPLTPFALEYKYSLLFIFFFVLWGLFGLTQSPGFGLDEAGIVDPAFSIMNKGYLSFPSAGTGNSHESAYLYQTPLYFYLLAGWYKIVGVGMWQGRLLSLVLASICLISIMLYMREYGKWAIFISICLLAIDPRSSMLAKMIRYDWPAILGVIFALFILNYRSDNTTKRGIWLLCHFIAGIFCGLAGASHLLYLIFVPLFGGLILLFPIMEKERLRQRIISIIFFCIGVLMAFLPVLIYIFQHIEAVQDQLLYQIGAHSQTETAFILLEWFKAELTKYVIYYKYIPFVLLFIIVSLAVQVYFLIFKPNAFKLEPQIPVNVIKRTAVTAIALPIILAFVSGHHIQHHVIVIPFWGLCCGMLAAQLKFHFQIFFKRLFVWLFILAFANGLLYSWAGRAYSAVQSWGTRDLSPITTEIEQIIPAQSSVYGNYTLIFIANEEKWDYVAQYYVFNTDHQALSKKVFDYIVLSNRDFWPKWLERSRYEFVKTLKSTEVPFKLPPINSDNVRLQLDIYRRIR